MGLSFLTGVGLPCPPPVHCLNRGIELRSPGLQADSLPCELPRKPKNTGVGSLSLLQGNFLPQESNRGLLYCRWILYHLRYQGSPSYDVSQFSSVQFSSSVVSNSSWPHGMQHAGPPCPSLTPRVYLNSWPLSQWCHPPMSFTVVSFYYCPRSFPASGSFQMSQLFISGGQIIGVSDSTSVLPMNTQDWSP